MDFVVLVLNFIQNPRVAKIAEQANTKYKLVLRVLRVKRVLLDVVLEHDKQLIVLQRLIVFVLKTFVFVLMVFKLLELLVLLMVSIFVPRAPVDITKLAVHVRHVLLHVDLVLD